MADKRKFAYYLKGNKLALIQREDALAGSNNSEYGMYKSPTETITDGLELQYSYSPTWFLKSGHDQEGTNREFRCLGYTFVNNGRLAFVLPEQNFGSSPAFAANEKVLVQGGPWNGIHTVHSIAYTGLLVTKTQGYSEERLYGGITLQCNFSASAKTITGNNAGDKNQINDLFPSGTHYVFVGGTEVATDADNENSLYKVSSDGEGTLTATAQYTLTNFLPTESTTPTLADETNDNVGLAKVNYNPFRIYEETSFDELEDETFELDLSRYQANAVVYYLKAKIAEDMGEMELREFHLREFKRQLEKGTSAFKRGPHIVQGFKEMR